MSDPQLWVVWPTQPDGTASQGVWPSFVVEAPDHSTAVRIAVGLFHQQAMVAGRNEPANFPPLTITREDLHTVRSWSTAPVVPPECRLIIHEQPGGTHDLR